MTKLLVTKTFYFESAHQLPGECIYGNCANMHGHSYKMEVSVSAENLLHGMVINFKDLKKIVNDAIVSECDHKFLNNVFPDMAATTCENMIYEFWKKLEPIFIAQNLTLERIRLWETKDSYAELIRNDGNTSRSPIIEEQNK